MPYRYKLDVMTIKPPLTYYTSCAARPVTHGLTALVPWSTMIVYDHLEFLHESGLCRPTHTRRYGTLPVVTYEYEQKTDLTGQPYCRPT